jgi:transposase
MSTTKARLNNNRIDLSRYTPTHWKSERLLVMRRFLDSSGGVIRAGFLSPEDRADLIALARDGSAVHRLARRANALVLLDDCLSFEEIARVLFVDDDTIRSWFRLYEEDGIDGLAWFGHEGSACQLSGAQQEKLKAWIAACLPRTTRQIGAFIKKEFCCVYESRSGLSLGLEYHKPNVIPRKLDEEKQKAFTTSTLDSTRRSSRQSFGRPLGTGSPPVGMSGRWPSALRRRVCWRA